MMLFDAKPDVSIVIVNHNAREMLRGCLRCLAANRGSASIELILIDNCSADGSVEMAKQEWPGLVLVEPGRNIGYVPANNIGLRRSRGRYVLFLNNDTLVEPDAITVLIQFMDSHPGVGAASGLILNPDGTDQGCARRVPTLANGLFGRRSVLTRIWPSNPWSRRYMLGWQKQGDEPFEVEILSSAALLLPTDDALALGGMDEAFELYWVDAEICARVRRSGRSVFCVPAARIVHFEGQGGSTRTFRMRMKSTLAFHRDAYRAYVRIRQIPGSHPRALLVAGALSVRAVALGIGQFLRPARATSSGTRTAAPPVATPTAAPVSTPAQQQNATLPPIPIFRPDISEADIAAVVETLRSGWIGAGPRVQRLEREFAEYVGAGYAVATSTCSGALMAALAVRGIGEGDEVIVPSFTWPSVFQVLRTLGATPVFADIEPETLSLDPADVERRITPLTRGIVVVHHGGHVADLEALRHIAAYAGIWLMDDAAHACGTIAADGKRIGSHCDSTIFSFNAVKNLSAGDGGMLTTHDPDFARRAKTFASLGLDRDTYARYRPGGDEFPRRWAFDLKMVGQRLHMNDITAALASSQLRRLDELNSRRAALVARYRAGLSGVSQFRFIDPRPGTQPSWHMFTVLMPDRDHFIKLMSERGIAVGVHYPPIHQFALARPWADRPLPVTESIAARTTTFPLYPGMTDEVQDRVIEAAVAAAGHLRIEAAASR
jgi:perosamine synthetase